VAEDLTFSYQKSLVLCDPIREGKSTTVTTEVVIYGSLFCQVCVVCCLLSAVCCLLSTVCCLRSAVCCLLSAVCQVGPHTHA
jgi:hypothetical protein